MAVNIGTAPDSGDGDPIRVAFDKINTELADMQQQLDETEITARSDTLQPGETIADSGSRFDAAGRRWETINDNAVVPDPLTAAALLASDDFEEHTKSQSFGDAQISVRALDLFENREVIQQTGGVFDTNPSQQGLKPAAA